MKDFSQFEFKYFDDKLKPDFQDLMHRRVRHILLVSSVYDSFILAQDGQLNELMKHSQSLISEGINLAHKQLRMRARPKILLCGNFEEAWEYYQSYEEHILGIISDVRFSVMSPYNCFTILNSILYCIEV